VAAAAQAEEFLRLTQLELHTALNNIKLEYVIAIRTQANNVMRKRFDTLRDAIKGLDPKLQPELQDEIIGTCYGLHGPLFLLPSSR
jgi:hypothetical protein